VQATDTSIKKVRGVAEGEYEIKKHAQDLIAFFGGRGQSGRGKTFTIDGEHLLNADITAGRVRDINKTKRGRKSDLEKHRDHRTENLRKKGNTIDLGEKWPSRR